MNEVLPVNSVPSEQTTALTVVKPRHIELSVRAIHDLTNWFKSKQSDDIDACMLEEYKNQETGEIFKIWPLEKQKRFNLLAEFISKNKIADERFIYTARTVHFGSRAGEWIIFRELIEDSALDQFANSLN